MVSTPSAINASNKATEPDTFCVSLALLSSISCCATSILFLFYFEYRMVNFRIHFNLTDQAFQLHLNYISSVTQPSAADVTVFAYLYNRPLLTFNAGCCHAALRAAISSSDNITLI